MKTTLKTALILAMSVSATLTAWGQPHNSPMVSGSLISVAALRNLKRRYRLTPQ